MQVPSLHTQAPPLHTQALPLHMQAPSLHTQAPSLTLKLCLPGLLLELLFYVHTMERLSCFHSCFPPEVALP